MAITVLLLLAAFIIGSVIPVPSEGDEARQALERQVRERLPSWQIATLSESYERSWVVGLRCGDERLDFRLLRDARPSGGLAWGDYWIVPGNSASYQRLREITDEISGWLIWREEPSELNRLPCETAAAPWR